MPAPYIELGANNRVEWATGEHIDRVIGDRALLASAAQGQRIQVVSALGKHQLDLVESSIESKYLTLEAGKYLGAPLADDNTDPGGVFKLQNNTGKDLWLDHVVLALGSTAAAAATVDVGVSANPLAAGGSNSIFDGIDVRNGGAIRNFDSRWAADHPAAGRPSQLWLNTEWLSVTKITGDVTGLAGRILFRVTAINDLKTVF